MRGHPSLRRRYGRIRDRAPYGRDVRTRITGSPHVDKLNRNAADEVALVGAVRRSETARTPIAARNRISFKWSNLVVGKPHRCQETTRSH